MIYRFPLSDVIIEITEEKHFVNTPEYSDEWMQISQTEFSLTIDDIAHYYVRAGKLIQITPSPKASKPSIELYLNGSVYGAVLHQRMILPIHGSCFNFNGTGIMVCGESGAGKSTVTASFCMNGSDFLTDDVSPIVFNNGKPQIWAMSDRIKLWGDSLEQLKQEKDGLHQIDHETEKFYYPMDSDKGTVFPLNQIFLLAKHTLPEVKFEELAGVEKFTSLRNEIYRWEFLQGMPQTEASYFSALALISQSVKVCKVFRPEVIHIDEFRLELETFLYTSSPVE